MDSAFFNQVITILLLLYAAWLPVSLGIQAMYRYRDGKKLAAGGLLLVGWGFNLMFFALLKWQWL